MKNVLALTAIAATATVASALPTLPRLTWTVSQDGGTTWESAASLLNSFTVLVRAQLSWTETGTAPIGLGAAVCSFDATLTGLDAADSVSNITKGLVPVADAQVLAFTRIGSVGKIDVNSDAAAAGAGLGWCNTGQGTPNGIGAQFNPNNPVTVLSYTFHFGGADHLVNVGAIMNGTTNQAARVYLTTAGGTQGGGQFSRAEVEVVGAVFGVIPTPSSLSLLALGSLAAVRRQRS